MLFSTIHPLCYVPFPPGSRLVEDVLLKGKYWRDTLSYAEEHKDSICVYGLKIVFHSPSMTEMSKKRFFACIHLHNALRNFGIRSALAVHIDLSGIQHKKVAEISQRIVQLVGDGYNFFALQFKITQTNDAMRKLFSEPGAYGMYDGEEVVSLNPSQIIKFIFIILDII